MSALAQPSAAANANPMDSVRAYVGALAARGRLLRLPEMDQDRFELTAFAYRLLDEYGPEHAPAFLVEAPSSRLRGWIQTRRLARPNR